MSDTRKQSDYAQLLRDAYVQIKELRERATRAESSQREPVAIVGIGCRFPGGSFDPESFWTTLRDGTDAIEPIPPERWDAKAVDAVGEPVPQFAGLLRDVDRFAAGFFGIAPVEATRMDPQHRLLLELAWEALENAGIAPDSLAGSRTGVFIGISTNDYSKVTLDDGGGLGAVDAYFGTGNSPSVAAGRLSYVLGLQGPCLSVDTACSSSLVAVHLACESLLRGECDLALAGGVNLILRPDMHVAFARARMLAPDGRCKTFDAAADGYVRGEGCGVVVLRRLSRAIEESERVWAVVRGSAMNQDGRSGGLTAPNGPAQEALIRQALSVGGVVPAEVGYVEAHGTGTPLGDPIEMQALAAALERDRPEAGLLYVASLKSNIGHLEAAAGIAGLIKAALVLHFGEILSHLHLRQPNPKIQWERLRVAVPARRTPWPAEQPKIAGVSSFAFSGTNAHVVLAAGPDAPVEQGEGLRQLLAVSAKSEAALRTLALRYAEWFEAHPDMSLEDACFTAAQGRCHWKHRLAILCKGTQDAARELRMFAGGTIPSATSSGHERLDLARRQYLAGQRVNWAELYNGRHPTKVSLPTYPFERERYWVGAPREQTSRYPSEADRQNWFYRVEWNPAPIPTQKVSPANLVEELRLAFQHSSAASGLSRYRDLLPVLERVAAAFASRALTEIGPDDDCVPASRRKMLSRIRDLVRQQRTETVEPNAEELAADLRRRFSEDTVELTLLERCGKGLAGVLRGDIDPLSLLAPNGDATLLEALYQRTVPARVFNATVANAVSACVAGGSSREARILEVGGGTGGTTSAILQQLEKFRGEYTFTDVSAAFLAPARAKFRGHEFMRYRTLDLDAETEPQGFVPYSFDVIVAANILHATGSVAASLARLRQLLAPGGMLVLLEVTRPSAWLDLTFGLTDGWSKADDGRPAGNPLLTVEQWRAVLSQEFVDVQCIPGGRIDGWQAVVLAQATNRISKDWMLLRDRGGIGEALAAKLRARGDQVHLSMDAAPDFFSKGLRVLDLRGCDATSCATVAELKAFQRAVCSGALENLRMAEAAPTEKPRVWLGTRGAQWCGGEGEQVEPGGATLWGLGRVWASEFPLSFGGLVDLPPLESAEVAASLLLEHFDASDCAHEQEVALRCGGRLRPRLTVCAPPESPELRLLRDGAYLIAGGTGGMGRLIARWAGERGAGHIVLAGRSPSRPDLEREIAGLENLGAKVSYVCANIAEEADVRRILDIIKSAGMPLRGVIHAAGIFDDRLLSGQDEERFERVLAPKVYGAWNLHVLTRDQPLDFFVLMSSAAGILGPPGMSNYAAANTFLDALAHHRRVLGLPAASIAWGPWAGIGMADAVAPKQAVQWEASGVGVIPAGAGLEILGRLAAADTGHIAVLSVDWHAYIARMGNRRPPALIRGLAESHGTAARTSAPVAQLRDQLRGVPDAARHTAVLDHIRTVAARIMGHADARVLDPDVPLADYGLDSLIALSITRELSATCCIEFPGTLLFDYPTASALAGHILSLLTGESPAAGVTPAAQPDAISARDPIAIIGMSCRFPGGANGPESFWQLLREGRTGIRKIPAGRWPADAWFDPDPSKPGKVNTEWGGFIDEVDQFDAQFFGIAPREAEAMDPQQRVLLEVSAEALEHAGVPLDRLAGSATGVFIGIYNNDYGRLVQDPLSVNAYVAIGNSGSIAAGRLSYVLGLQGPAIAIDTACSSSLVAVHLACQSLRTGESSMALAGGVSLMLSPMSMLMVSQLRMLAPDGRCKVFDASANGFVRGEGCGVVVLKRLRDAEASGDSILAVIRGSAVNQDGRSSGITAPNGRAQEMVLGKALADARVQPGEIELVEAHGTGTALGDPIEVRALDAVLGRGRDAQSPLYIGSVKGNIGHLEAAAGVAGLIKAVLAVTHEEIFAQPHFRTPNPHVAWDRVPLKVPKETLPWKRVLKPRLASVSSFGFSGTNAHVVLEEGPVAPHSVTASRGANVLTLSAKTEAALRVMAEQWSCYKTTEDFHNICFTANNCRARYPWRLALVASSFAEAQTLLGRFAAGERDAVWNGYAEPGGASAGEPLRATSAESTQLDELARLYVVGGTVDWTPLGTPHQRRKLDLPRYPFQRSRYWLPAAKEPARRETPPTPPLHPLLGRRIRSIARDVQYEAAISASNPAFLEHHCIYGMVVVPATAFLEIAVAAGTEHFGTSSLVLREVSFLQALVLTSADTNLQFTLTPGDGWARFQIASFPDSASAPVFHAAGEIHRAEALGGMAPELESIRRGIGGPASGAEDFYEAAALNGFQFGESFRGIQSVWRKDGEALARVVRPSVLEGDAAMYRFHPALLDACLQVFGATLPADDLQPAAYVPVRIASLSVERSPAAALWCHARLDAGVSHAPEVFTTDLDIFDAEGRSVTAVRGFTTRRVESSALARLAGRHDSECLYRIEWRHVDVEPTAPPRPLSWLVVKPQAAESTWIRLVENSTWDGVAFVCGEDDTDESRLCHSFMTLAQTLVRGVGPRRLTLVTRGSQPVPGSSTPLALAQATLWGAASTFMLEHPEIECRLIDIDPAGTSDAAPFLAADTEPRVAVRGSQTFVPRLTRIRALPMPSDPAPARPGAYLVTGGTGALGLAAARWLASRGASHIVLVGRRHPDAGVLARCREIEGPSCEIIVRQANVAHEEELARVFNEIDRALPPLRGIIHAAGVVTDAPFRRQTAPGLDEVMAPKICGVRNLERFTDGRPLDFFVVFSSAASLWGSPGQANYAAANAWLDAWAHRRRQAGLTALSINWGPWAGDGMAARSGATSGLRRFGVDALSADVALAAMERLLQADLAQAAVVALNWAKLRETPLWRWRSGLFAEFAVPLQGPTETKVAEEHAAILRRIHAAPPSSREILILEMIRDAAAGVMGVADSSELDVRRPLSELGLDSFMAMDLVRRAESIAGRTLSPTIVFQYPSLADLARYVGTDLLRAQPADAGAAASADNDDALVQEVAAMGAQEVQSVLRNFLENG
jgi:acyl transferase domain-containing protein/SAM-dependent methyltransferase/acyl carrier protein